MHRRIELALAMAMAVTLARPLPGALPGDNPQRVAPPVKVPQPGAPPATPPAESPPTDAALGGIPVLPGAQFLASYDAGLGQRYHLFGTLASFAEVVAYYKSVLRQKGELVYDDPPVHMFEVGRFREQTMAFPPGVTVKDYSWRGGTGYLHVSPGAQPRRFPTIIQIVPPPGLPAPEPF